MVKQLIIASQSYERALVKKDTCSMLKSDLVKNLSNKLDTLTQQDAQLGVATIIDTITDQLADNNRIEIRGFGSLSLRYRPPPVRHGESYAGRR